MKRIIPFIFIFSVLILAGCGSGESSQKQEEAMLDSLLNDSEAMPEISEEVVQDIIKSIPSPLEIASIIKESGAPYNKEILNPTKNADKYNSMYTKALNLGIYGADMGYINLYNKNAASFKYISSIKQLADDLRVGQFFDFSTLKRLARNSDNIDSLLYISTSGFEKMDLYLKENKRGNISALILIGGWLESLYIATQVAESGTISDISILTERIGEQKIVLDDILLILGAYKNDAKTYEYKILLENLKTIYDDVVIKYEYVEPEMVEVDGMLVILDNSSSTVEISKEQVKEITKLVKEIRTKITQ